MYVGSKHHGYQHNQQSIWGGRVEGPGAYILLESDPEGISPAPFRWYLKGGVG